MSNRGFENRYSKDGGGNHIQAIRDEGNSGLVLNLNIGKRTCTQCRKVKPLKGGTQANKSCWRCKECKEKSK